MQLISCAQCRKTWKHREEENPPPASDRVLIQTSHLTPCFHGYMVDVSYHSRKSVFEPVPYIPTLTDMLDVELVALLFKGSVTENFIGFYHDIIGEDLVDFSPVGEPYLKETLTYAGQEMDHCVYFEQEETFYIFTLSQLRVLAYLYKKDPVHLIEQIAAWKQEHHPDIWVEELHENEV